jgi:hypothetical protein
MDLARSGAGVGVCSLPRGRRGVLLPRMGSGGKRSARAGDRPVAAPRWLVRVLVGISVLGLAGCCRRCGVETGEKTYETHTGKVRASLVRSTSWGTKVPIPGSSFAVRVETTPPFDEETTCSKVVFAEDPTGKLLGFRCHDAKTWTVLRLRGGARRLRDCDVAGSKEAPNWSTLLPISSAAEAMLRCDGSKNVAILRAISEDEGEAPARARALALADERPSNVDGDAWRLAIDGLPEELRAKAEADVCGRLLEAGRVQSANLFLRAVARCDLRDPRVGDAAMAVLGETLEAPTEPGYRPGLYGEDPRSRTIRWAALVASRARPQEAGAFACARLPGSIPRDQLAYTWAPLASVVGRGGQRCDHLDGFLRDPPCGEEVACGASLCETTSLRADTRAWDELPLTPQGADRVLPELPRPSRAMLHALRANGPLPREVTVRHARSRYALPANSALPACAVSLAPNTACVCPPPHDLRWAACGVGADDTQGSWGPCGFHLDDIKKRIDDVRMVCKTLGADCDDFRSPCCGGLRCVSARSGGYACQPDEAAPGAAPSASR